MDAGLAWGEGPATRGHVTAGGALGAGLQKPAEDVRFIQATVH